MREVVKKLVFTILIKLYKSIKNIEYREVVNQQKKCISQLYKHGANVYLGDTPSICGHQYISCGDNVRFSKGARIEAIAKYKNFQYSPCINIGSNVSVEDYCHIGCVDSISIGDGCLIASNVLIIDHFHGKTEVEDLKLKPTDRYLEHKPIVIGKNVWIGNNVCILPGVVLGDNVIVGANAVVTKSFPANCVIAGVPAKIIKILE